ncbi:sulfate ABC transporter substrate-binding protein [Chelativorans sp. ZYF759]|uniref:sulfate ABC transporter substrate-binding protein n=1 Tax=Chelativorans sp. ZYF759 TaxID=2692213 RepID=UPI00145CC22D|nr:sulfate ABC transporter substrate-binding protein [Chelativorans sp. ZYF759]NMG37820.1 sulfate ABC transporter substrate-binding protein [Chelativorans sp. ZYF759]
MKRFAIIGATVAALAGTATVPAQAQDQILNASYDIARELFVAINAAFVPAYETETGVSVTVDQSHGGTSRQARSIAEGLEADVVTFNQVTDIDFLVEQGFVAEDWQSAFDNNASPYYSLPAFIVRAGNPKNIQDWDDLVREDVQVIFPNPKTSGNARYTYLAATAFALEAFDGDQEQVGAFITQIFDNVPVFDTGGRGATTTFVERQLGDVLITFEAETQGIAREFGQENFETVIPSQSLLAEFPVAVVDRVAERRGTEELARAYLGFLYSEEGQRILAEHGNRVHDEAVAAEFSDQFPEVRLVTVEDVFGGWDQVQEEHFNAGARLDQLFGER